LFKILSALSLSLFVGVQAAHAMTDEASAIESGEVQKTKQESSTLRAPQEMAVSPTAKVSEKNNKIPSTRRDFLEIIRKSNEKLKLDPKSADAYLDLGYASGELGRWQDDLDYCNKSIDLNPDVAVAYAERAKAYSSLREDKKAMEDLDRAIKMDPNNSAFESHRGWIFGRRGEYEKAIEACTKSIAIWDGYSPAYFCRGRSYNRIGEHDKAIADLSKAIALYPNEVSDYYVDRAFAYLQKHDYANTLKDLVVAIRLDPNDRFALVYRGIALSKSGALTDAITDLNRAVELSSNDATALMNRAILFRLTREFESAMADLDKAQQLEPKNAIVARERGLTFLAMNKPEEAIAQFKVALQLDPDDQESSQRLNYASFLKTENTEGGLQRKTHGFLDVDVPRGFAVDPPSASMNTGQSLAEIVKAIRLSGPNMSSHLPSTQDFNRLLSRDCETFFQKSVGKPVRVEFELLRDLPTLSARYPLFYCWVKVYDGSVVVKEGGMRLEAINKTAFSVANFLSTDEIKADPGAVFKEYPLTIGIDMLFRAGVKPSDIRKFEQPLKVTKTMLMDFDGTIVSLTMQ
jgi:tetratricopeptide (TPR) repeat protein